MMPPGTIPSGYLGTIHFFGYWLGAVIAAKVPLAPRTMMRFSLLAIGISVYGMGVTGTFEAWLALRWLAGVCSAWALVLVSNYAVRHLSARGSAHLQGWIFSGVGAGIGFAGTACLVFMVSRLGSAVSWQILGLLSLSAAAALCLALGPELPATRPARGGQGSRRGPLDWRIVIAYGVMGAGYIIPASYLPVMARGIVDAPIVFGWTWPVFGGAAFASTLIAAKLQGRFTNRRIWAASQAVMAFGLLLAAVRQDIAAIIIAGVCIGGTFMIITMTGMREAHRIAPAEDVLRHIAVMTTAFATGQMIGPVFASAVHDLTGSFTVSLAIAGAALAATALSLAVRPAPLNPPWRRRPGSRPSAARGPGP